MAHLLTDDEYDGLLKLLGGAFTGRGVSQQPGIGVAIGPGVRMPPVIFPRQSDACAIKDIRYNTSLHAIQVTKVCSTETIPDSQWTTKVQFDPCDDQSAAPARMFGTASASEAGGEEGTIFGDSRMTLSAPNSITVQISTANTNRTDSGTFGTLNTAGASGGSLFRVYVKAAGSTDPGAIRIWHQPGGSGTKYLIGEIPVPGTNLQAAADRTWEGSWTPADTANGFILDNGDKIYVSTHAGNTFNVTGIAADV